MGWIIGFFNDEADTAAAGYWDGDSIGLVADEANPGDALNSAFFYGEAGGNDLAIVRAAEGEFQQQFTDYDVRLLPAQQTITIV